MARPNTSEGDKESFPQAAPPFVVSYRPCCAVPAKMREVSVGSMARLITPVPGGNPLFLATQCPPPSVLRNVADWFAPAHTVAGTAGSMASATTAPPGRPEPATISGDAKLGQVTVTSPAIEAAGTRGSQRPPRRTGTEVGWARRTSAVPATVRHHGLAHPASSGSQPEDGTRQVAPDAAARDRPDRVVHGQVRRASPPPAPNPAQIATVWLDRIRATRGRGRAPGSEPTSVASAAREGRSEGTGRARCGSTSLV